VAIKPMRDRVPMAGLLVLLAGGIAYTAGGGCYAASSRVRYAHFVWHLFVMAGTALHYFSVYWYAA
jgi:hemolysin III